MKKGASETMLSIMLIFIVLAFALIYIIAVNNQVTSRLTSNLRESNSIRLQNVFALTNRSLAMTWYMHTAQAVFSSADTSLGCGYDSDIVPQDYWYYYDGSSAKNTMELNDFLDDGTRKYYTSYPHVCYPFQDSLIKEINDSFNGMKSIKTEFEVNGLGVKLEKIVSDLKMEGDTTLLNYNKDADGTGAAVSQIIKVGNAINEEINSSVKIFNPLSDVLEAGR